MTSRSILFAALLAASAPSAVCLAQAADPATKTVDGFNDSLLGVMKQAKSLGVQGRYKELQPAVERAFDLPAMTRFAVGPKWAGLSSQEQDALVRAFTRLSAANYAHSFDGYDGQKFVIDPKVETRGPDKLVRTQMLSPSDKPVDFTYRMRQAPDGRWKIIDVYFGAISQLATRRSDFSSTMDTGGAPALVKKIDALADKQLK
jgi:phospholipid transport system substrate-binding protein